MLFSGTIFKSCIFPLWVPTPLPQIFIFNPFLNWSRVHAKAKNGSFTLCLHISLCCINNASKSERHKSHIATGWQNKEPDTRDWASVLEGVKAELGKSPRNSSRKISYYKRRGSESACQWCCTEKRDCTMPFLIPGVGENSGSLTVGEKKLEKFDSHFVFGHSSSGFAHS